MSTQSYFFNKKTGKFIYYDKLVLTTNEGVQYTFEAYGDGAHINLTETSYKGNVTKGGVAYHHMQIEHLFDKAVKVVIESHGEVIEIKEF